MKKYQCPKCGHISDEKVERCPNCNVLFKYPEDKKVEEEKPATFEEKEIAKAEENLPAELNSSNAPSYFDGKVHQYIGWNLLGALLSFVTLGICYPIAYAWLVKWECRHTVVKGYRQKFDGVVASLLPRWILWEFLTLITLTIFGWWTPIRLNKWKVTRLTWVKVDESAPDLAYNTEDANERKSYFDGRFIQYLGWRLAGFFVTLFTLGICYPLAFGWMTKWECKHTTIDGYRLVFNGKAASLIGKWILWMLLSVITLFIFALWIPVKLRRWKVERLEFVKDKRLDLKYQAEEKAE